MAELHTHVPTVCDVVHGAHLSDKLWQVVEAVAGGPEDVGRGGHGASGRGSSPPPSWGSTRRGLPASLSGHLCLTDTSPCPQAGGAGHQHSPCAAALLASLGAGAGSRPRSGSVLPSSLWPPPGWGQPGWEGSWAALTQHGEVLLVVEAAGRLSHTPEVHLALVAHAVHIGGAIGPRHAGHAPACLHIPATNVHHTTWLPFPSWGDSGPAGRLSPGHKAEPQPAPAQPPPSHPGLHSPSCEPHSQSGPRTTIAPWKMPLNRTLARPSRGLSVTLQESGFLAMPGSGDGTGPGMAGPAGQCPHTPGLE